MKIPPLLNLIKAQLIAASDINEAFLCSLDDDPPFFSAVKMANKGEVPGFQNALRKKLKESPRPKEVTLKAPGALTAALTWGIAQLEETSNRPQPVERMQPVRLGSFITSLKVQELSIRLALEPEPMNLGPEESVEAADRALLCDEERLVATRFSVAKEGRVESFLLRVEPLDDPTPILWVRTVDGDRSPDAGALHCQVPLEIRTPLASVASSGFDWHWAEAQLEKQLEVGEYWVGVATDQGDLHWAVGSAGVETMQQRLEQGWEELSQHPVLIACPSAVAPKWPRVIAVQEGQPFLLEESGGGWSSPKGSQPAWKTLVPVELYFLSPQSGLVQVLEFQAICVKDPA